MSSLNELDRIPTFSDDNLILLSKSPYAAGDSDSSVLKYFRFYLAEPTGWKGACVFRTIGNVDLAGGGLAAGTTHDGVVAASGADKRALVMDQTDPTENGIYDIPAAGAATRSADFDDDSEIAPGDKVYVYEGTLHANTAWEVTSAEPHVPDTNDITFGAWTPPAVSGTDADAIHDNVAGEIAALTEKASPVAADWVLLEDSEDGNNKKKAQAGNLPGGSGGASGSSGSVELFADIDCAANSQASYDIDMSALNGRPFYIVLSNVGFSAAANARFRVSTDGVTFDAGATDYEGTWIFENTSSVTQTDGMMLETVIAVSTEVECMAIVHNLDDPNRRTQCLPLAWTPTDDDGAIFRPGRRDIAQAETHIRIYNTGAGTFNAGHIKVYAEAGGSSSGSGGLTELAVANNDFASGDLTSWTVDAGGFTVAATSPQGGEAPQFGGFLASPNDNAVNTISQNVDVSTYATEIDGGAAEFMLSCRMQNTHDDQDSCFAAVEWLDGVSASLHIDRLYMKDVQDNTNASDKWRLENIRMVAPANARTAKVILNANRADTGTVVNLDIDGVWLYHVSAGGGGSSETGDYVKYGLTVDTATTPNPPETMPYDLVLHDPDNGLDTVTNVGEFTLNATKFPVGTKVIFEIGFDWTGNSADNYVYHYLDVDGVQIGIIDARETGASVVGGGGKFEYEIADTADVYTIRHQSQDAAVTCLKAGCYVKVYKDPHPND